MFFGVHMSDLNNKGTFIGALLLVFIVVVVMIYFITIKEKFMLKENRYHQM